MTAEERLARFAGEALRTHYEGCAKDHWVCFAREAIALLRDERKYLSHTNKCALTNMQPAEMVYPDCTCGFYKLMARHKEFLDGEGGDE